MNRLFGRALLATLLLIGSASFGRAAVNVGTLDFPGDTISGPILFHDSLNTLLDGGLTFTIAPGTSGSVKLDFAATTPNVTLIAATLTSLTGGPQAGPISLLTGTLGPGTYDFNLSAIVGGGGDGGVGVKLTLTPIPASLALFGSAALGLGALTFRRKSQA